VIRLKLRWLDNIDELKLREILIRMKFDNYLIERTIQKFSHNKILLEDITQSNATIIEEEMTKLGGEVIVNKSPSINVSANISVIIIGNDDELVKLCKKIKVKSSELNEMSNEIENRSKRTKESREWNIKGGKILLKRPIIMGILNITPDSFYDGGRYFDEKKAKRRIAEMLEEGADIIDIGGMSSRPGSEEISEGEELKRVLPLVKEAVKLGATISVDTYRSSVADNVINAGAHIINDISSLRWDDRLVKVVSSSGVGLVLMHSLTIPKDMQKAPEYKDVVSEIYEFLEERISFAEDSGISRNSIVIDFGIGFGKRLCDNLTLIYNIETFKGLGRPILVGASRKSFIGHALGLEEDMRLIPSIAVAIYSIMKGADVIRVHDVRATKEALEMVNCIDSEGFTELINKGTVG
jgi:dihydropteroate synthase